jgi:uncharacterized protein
MLSPSPSASFVPVRYPVILATCTLLFVLRVAGQILVAFRDVGFLPPFAEWYSGLMPYWMLLPVQLVMIVGMVWIVRDFARGRGLFIALKARTGMVLMVLGGIYAGSMVVRYVATMALHPELRWFTGTIPIWFHLVLATFIVTLGHYQVWRARKA